MTKILGYIAVLMVFSWVTVANASPVGTIVNSNGVLTISGFADANPDTLNFLFDFTPGQSGLVTLTEPVTTGTNYAVHVGFTIPGLPIPGVTTQGPDFLADFDIVSLFPIAAGSESVDNILTGLYVNNQRSFTPQNAFLTVLGDTMQLLTVDIGDADPNPLSINPTLLLTTKVISGDRLLSFLNRIDGAETPPANGSVTSPFSSAHAEVSVPEPTTFLLLGSGLLGMLGFSRKRA